MAFQFLFSAKSSERVNISIFIHQTDVSSTALSVLYASMKLTVCLARASIMANTNTTSGFQAHPEATTRPESPDIPKSPADSYTWVPKHEDCPPAEWKPFLTSFSLFPELALEIRQMIWKCTLKPRIVELNYREEHGFYSRVKAPVALQVCSESRNAVEHLYSLRFGSVLDEPAIRFNFFLDTLYFDIAVSEDIIHFLALLKLEEVNHIKYLAIDHLVHALREWSDEPMQDSLPALRKAACAMPELKEFLVVYKLDEDYHEHGLPSGSGTMQLYEKFPWDLYEYMACEGCHLDDEDGESECQELPNSEHLVEGVNVKKAGSVWGWRPKKLEIVPPPWM
ncbi:hypothetical protein LAWI1_G007529 [Lachnellula willkommii]|uniref:2EXR domain-containing protein n=1 Tax=Lachnellula willkommii TaxID=215461 RepID=A0A559M3U2_9HELO|nr:hypothetical protein LAWI1_G007529 [Lachnellula willkommii]